MKSNRDHQQKLDATEKHLPIFLGISRRAARQGHEWNVLGLSRVVTLPFFPQSLSGLQCVIALHRDMLRSIENLSFRITFTDDSDPSNQAYINQNLVISSVESAGEVAINQSGFAVGPHLMGESQPYGWGFLSGVETEPGAYEFWPMPAPPLLVKKPCRVMVDLEIANQSYRLGEVVCGFVEPLPIGDAERRAIASRPNAPKAVEFNLNCRACNSVLQVYVLLNPSEPVPKRIKPNAFDVSEAPNEWACQCGQSVLDLSYLKRGMHDLLRHPQTSPNERAPLNYTPLYESGRIHSLVGEYEELILSSPAEEEVQKFLENNPLLWSFLSPMKIIHKPSVLTRKKADFGILTTQNILYLIEIEKPTTRLVNRDGSIAADIMRGANQIRDWELVVDDHRLALLAELGLKEVEVREIRFILIGGLVRDVDAVGLAKLRRSPLASKTQFLCFDDLGSSLHTMAAQLRGL